MDIIRAFLKGIIDRKGIKLNYLASKLSISNDLMSKSINGTRKITAEEFLKLCQILEVSQQDIMMLSASLAEASGETA